MTLTVRAQDDDRREYPRHSGSNGGWIDQDGRAPTHLANERTFLAWLRTGLGLVVLGVGAAQFLELDRNLVPGLRVVTDFAALLIVVGILTAVAGRARYVRGRRQIDQAQFEAAERSITVATVFIAVVGFLSLVLVALMGRA